MSRRFMNKMRDINENKDYKPFFIGAGIAVALIILIVIIGISINNTEIELRQQTKAQQKTCEANFDKMFKSISQISQVADENMKRSKEAFKEIYIDLVKGRYDNARGGALMSWVHEANPQFDLAATASLYIRLANAIEANRDEFFNEQRKLIDFQREHASFIQKWPASWILSEDEIEITVITSAKTKQVYETGEENDVNIFNNKE